MKANDYTEVLLWSTDAYMTTMSDAAKKFATYWWDKPRDIEVITDSVPEYAPGMFSRVTNGTNIYRIVYMPDAQEYNVYRYL